MRTLVAEELDQVSGGAVPLVAVAVKYALPALATIAAATYMTVRALDHAKELCKDGANAQVKSKVVEMSCSAPKKAEVSVSSPPVDFNERDGMLKAKFPDAIFV